MDRSISIFIFVYILLSFFIAGVDFFVAEKAFQKKSDTGKYLAYTSCSAAIVEMTYMWSVLSDSKYIVSIASSMYFIFIDVMLLFLIHFCARFVHLDSNRLSKFTLSALKVYLLFEVLVFVINPFKCIAIDFYARPTFFAYFGYDMKALYVMHLIYTYIMVSLCLAMLIKKAVGEPSLYRKKYLYPALTIIGVVCTNAVFLYLPGDSIFNLLDYSIFGYSITLAVIYWSAFRYTATTMLKDLSKLIFDEIGQGLVLFDHEGYMIMKNEEARRMLHHVQFRTGLHMEDFENSIGITSDSLYSDDMYSMQCYPEGENSSLALRCDFHRLRNNEKGITGNLYVFTDTKLATDLVTGFNEWESFSQNAMDNPMFYRYPVAAAVFDINNLAEINSHSGTSAGNAKLRELAALMHRFFPDYTQFVRGRDANLIALLSDESEEQMLTYMKRVCNSFSEKVECGVCVSDQKNPDILDAIERANKSMQIRKLLDGDSSKSQMVASLVKALEESDDDTKEHVSRTQKMGAILGERIGLKDLERSQLSLLCLLHDIGKIGIPIEILNKPGHLSHEEWAVMRSHVEKGYQIAMSSGDLREIAEMILYHHERWDGTGYPKGLRGDAIPLLSRIISVVDAYDAMVHNRSYRKALSKDRAIHEIKRGAGSQFDPFIASEFVTYIMEEGILRNNVVPMKPVSERESRARVVEPVINPANIMMNIQALHCSRYILNERDVIIKADEAFEGITGYTRNDIRNRQIKQTDLILDEEKEYYNAKVQEIMTNMPFAYLEHRIRRKDGTTIYVSCYGRRYYDSAAKAERAEIIIADHREAMSVFDKNNKKIDDSNLESSR